MGNDNNINNLIQDINDIKKLTEERSKIDFNKSIEDLKAYNDVNKKNTINITSWISVIIGVIGLIITLAASYGTLRLTMQDYFNDVDNIKKQIKQIEKQVENTVCPLNKISNSINNMDYRITMLEKDFIPLDDFYNNIKNIDFENRIKMLEIYINKDNLREYKLDKLIKDFEEYKKRN
jgi:hypothetical protein